LLYVSVILVTILPKTEKVAMTQNLIACSKETVCALVTSPLKLQRGMMI